MVSLNILKTPVRLMLAGRYAEARPGSPAAWQRRGTSTPSGRGPDRPRTDR